jgi:hypothetical protein
MMMHDAYGYAMAIEVYMGEGLHFYAICYNSSHQ